MNIRELLTETADAQVPEQEPFADTIGTIRRRVRRRRAVGRASSAVVGLVGVAGIATVGTLTWQAAQPDPPPGPSIPVELCGRSVTDALDLPAGPVVGSAAVLAAEGLRVQVSASLGNDGPTRLTATGPDVILYLPDTDEVVAVGATDGADSIVLGQGQVGSVNAESTILACDAPDDAPLPDGQYGLSLTGTSRLEGGERADASWLVAGPLVEVRDGELVALGTDTPIEEPDDAVAGFLPTPECGEMIPVVPENVLWATAGADAGPHRPATSSDRESGGLTLDVTVGSLTQVGLTGSTGAAVAMVTDLDGVVQGWWLAEEAVTTPLDLSARDDQVLSGLAWHPLTAACAEGDALGEPLPDGDYRLFVAVGSEFEATDGSYEQSASAVTLTPPLDLTVAGGIVTVTSGTAGTDSGGEAAFDFPGTLPPDFPEGRMPPMDGVLLGSWGDAGSGWTIRGDYAIFDSPGAAVDQAIARLLPVGFTIESRDESGAGEPVRTSATLVSAEYRVTVWVTDPGDGTMPGGYTVVPTGGGTGGAPG